MLDSIILYKPNSRDYEVSIKRFGASADMSGQFGTGAEMSWVQSVLGPKCLDTVLPQLCTEADIRRIITAKTAVQHVTKIPTDFSIHNHYLE